ncbi:PIN domain-containing protein [Nanoarchaeota archaeon]
MNLVIDTNILISALIRNSLTRELIIKLPVDLLLPEFELLEIKKHKQEILRKSKLSEIEFDHLLNFLLEYVEIIKTEDIIDYKKEADEIINHIDPDDVQFVATALKYNVAIWSDDKHFQKQNKIKIFTTKDILEFLEVF